MDDLDSHIDCVLDKRWKCHRKGCQFLDQKKEHDGPYVLRKHRGKTEISMEFEDILNALQVAKEIYPCSCLVDPEQIEWFNSWLVIRGEESQLEELVRQFRPNREFQRLFLATYQELRRFKRMKKTSFILSQYIQLRQQSWPDRSELFLIAEEKLGKKVQYTLPGGKQNMIYDENAKTIEDLLEGSLDCVLRETYEELGVAVLTELRNPVAFSRENRLNFYDLRLTDYHVLDSRMIKGKQTIFITDPVCEKEIETDTRSEMSPTVVPLARLVM